jgi:hypothetical protein
VATPPLNVPKPEILAVSVPFAAPSTPTLLQLAVVLPPAPPLPGPAGLPPHANAVANTKQTAAPLNRANVFRSTSKRCDLTPLDRSQSYMTEDRRLISICSARYRCQSRQGDRPAAERFVFGCITRRGDLR